MSDAMDSDVREVIRRRIALRERDGHERLLLNHEALRDLLDAADERDRLAAAVERVRALHVAVGIYDECDCDDDAKAEGHLDIYEVGMTCNKLYDVCDECCRSDEYQTEECADHHRHGLPGESHLCATLRALDGTDV